MTLYNFAYINISLECMCTFAHLFLIWISPLLQFGVSFFFSTLYIKNIDVLKYIYCFSVEFSFFIAKCPFSKVCRLEFIVRILCQVLELQIGRTCFVLKEQELPVSEKLIRQNRQLITSY